MIQASDVKEYLRIDYAEDDDFIARAITAGYTYLGNAIENFDALYSGNAAFAAQADTWILTQWCPPMYDQREGMFTDKAPTMDYMARAMLTQLQMYKYEPEEEEDIDG